ncbi:aminotransferase class V-fold PLP-dependent enzyme [Fulvivirga sp. 29W222]|uniref:Aminotransferase class V-fold PLP-dependent enzyme n=1 Tax=Fulvivirga marina TaxID=2494733 RepID=A0A937G2X7_9BACT|nr:aminotransferase class V-fold PLP-dependent enzyme [Fulvivirga marina]MBL6447461.1 aminotransferase class V-fold PLP-dependent enzyme [Fulvivirga marina]
MDIQTIRQNTPGVTHVVHFNSAGASLVSQQVLAAQIDYLKEEAQYGGYETASKYESRLEEFYSEAAKLIHASPEEIAFTESATVAWQRAFFSIPMEKGDTILTTKAEYASNFISYLYQKEKQGINIKVVPSDGSGEIDLKKLEESIDESVKLISITHLPTNSGLVNPAEKVGELARKYNILYLLDACQSIGQYPIDVHKIGCHFLSATGRKYLRGPRGTGFLYANKEILKSCIPSNLDLHSANWIKDNIYEKRTDARIFETWESNVAAKMGLTQALKEVNILGIDNIWKRVVELSRYLRSELEKIETVAIKDIGSIQSGIVTFTSSMKASQLQEALNAKGFNTIVSPKNSTLLDMSDRNLEEVVRASVHYYNTEQEVDDLTAALRQIL